MNFVVGLFCVLVLFLIVWLIFILCCVFNIDIMEIENKKDKVSRKIFWAFAVIALVFCLYWDVTSYLDKWSEPELTSTEHITALSDSNNTEGRFYMRRGYVETNLYYNYMVELRSGGYKANKVPAGETVVYEADNNYRVEWYLQDKGYGLMKQKKKSWKVYIPKGSIADDYNIDLK